MVTLARRIIAELLRNDSIPVPGMADVNINVQFSFSHYARNLVKVLFQRLTAENWKAPRLHQNSVQKCQVSEVIIEMTANNISRIPGISLI